MKNIALLSGIALTIISSLNFGIMQSVSALSWDWYYSGSDIEACGTFTTKDTPNSSGFYQITGITGIRNGERIIGLQPTGTAIPGNTPYYVDNLISRNGPQLTDSGFGYSTSRGDAYNPYYTTSLPAGYFEVASNSSEQDTELPITFSANAIPGRSDILINSSLRCPQHKYRRSKPTQSFHYYPLKGFDTF